MVEYETFFSLRDIKMTDQLSKINKTPAAYQKWYITEVGPPTDTFVSDLVAVEICRHTGTCVLGSSTVSRIWREVCNDVPQISREKLKENRLVGDRDLSDVLNVPLTRRSSEITNIWDVLYLKPQKWTFFCEGKTLQSQQRNIARIYQLKV